MPDSKYLGLTTSRIQGKHGFDKYTDPKHLDSKIIGLYDYV